MMKDKKKVNQKNKNDKAVVIDVKHDLNVQFKKTKAIIPYQTGDSEIFGTDSWKGDIYSKHYPFGVSAPIPTTERKPKTCCGKFCGCCWNFETKPKGEPLSYSPGRNYFIRMILIICALMLAFTLAVVIITNLPILVVVCKEFAITWEAFFVMLACSMVAMMVSYIYCCSKCSRIFPINAILNIITMCCFSFICAYVALKFAAFIIVGAIMTTLVITLFCICLAFTSFDFTKCLLKLLVALLAMLVAIILLVILFFAFGIMLSNFRIFCFIFFSVISSVTIVTQIQVILKGYSVKIGEEEYAFGAYMLYTAIASLFLASMRGIGKII